MKHEIPWWNEWYEADCLKRKEMVEKLPVLKEMAEGHIKGKDKDILQNSFYSIINNLFEDLASYMLERDHITDVSKKVKGDKTMKCKICNKKITEGEYCQECIDDEQEDLEKEIGEL